MTQLRLCPVCGKQQTKILFRPKTSPGPVSECVNCSMVYIANIEDAQALIFNGPFVYDQVTPKILTSSNLDDVKGSWEFDELSDKELEWPALRRNAMDAIRRIELHVNKPCNELNILDVGSGWGFFLAAAKKFGWNTYGLEPLPASSVYARSTFGLNITTDTLHENTFPPDFFDIITSFQVFEHLPYPNEDVQHLNKIIRQDGIILIEVPNFETWTMRLMKAHHRHFVKDHLNFFSAETLSQLLTYNGFRVIDHYQSTRYMSVRHFVKHWAKKYLPGWLVNPLQSSIERNGLSERIVGLNIGDTVTVVARKVKSPFSTAGNLSY